MLRNEPAGFLCRAFLQIGWGAAWGPDGRIYVADMTGGHLVRVAPDGSMDSLDTWQNRSLLEVPIDVAFDGSGQTYIADGEKVYRVGSGGALTDMDIAASKRTSPFQITAITSLSLSSSERCSHECDIAFPDSTYCAPDYPPAWA